MSILKKKINFLILLISSKIIKLTIAFKAYVFCYIILLINIRKIKKIYKKKSNKKQIKILVFSKSGGLDDLISSQKVYNKNIQYYVIPRLLTRKIFNFFLEENLNDYKYLSNNSSINKKKLLYRNFIIEILKIFKTFFKLNAIISFNLLYKSDREIQYAARHVGIKFLVIQKECVNPPVEEKIFENIYKNHSGKFYGEKVATYSKAEKDRLVKSGIIVSKDIEVVGCPRLDLAFEYGKIKPNNKQITYYMIENDRFDFLKGLYSKKYLNNFIKFRNKNKKISWKYLDNIVSKNLILFAKKNPSYKIIFKGKTGVHTRDQLSKDLPKNCEYVDGGPGHKLLKTSKIVIGFNSTVVLEAIAARRDVLIPQFKKIDNFTKQFLLKINLDKFLVKSEKDFLNKLKFFSSKKIKKKLSNKEKEILSYYLGNIDGSSGKKLNDFLLESLNK